MPGGYQQPAPPAAYAAGPPPQGYAHPGYNGQEQHGPGVGERASEVAQAFGRHVRTPETKPFYKSSEFLVWGLTVLGVLIAGAAVDNSDHGDALRANLIWILVTAVSFAYIISRGISKAATKYQDPSQRDNY
jgi:hypothetical protein